MWSDNPAIAGKVRELALEADEVAPRAEAKPQAAETYGHEPRRGQRQAVPGCQQLPPRRLAPAWPVEMRTFFQEENFKQQDQA
jgi:hypothetical protein